VIQCAAGENPSSCLSATQVHVAEEIYRGAHDAAGQQLVISGPLPGSELNWAGVYVLAPGQDRAMSGVISEGTIKYLAYDPDPAASFKLADFKFDAPNFTATTQLHSLYDATDPDLSSFAAAGGKLILWHGLADPHISPLNTVAYYEAMQKVLGADKVDQFARLFLFPGGAHCGGGEGPFDMDLMSAIMTWVEKSKAPDVLIASHRKGDAAPGAGPPRDTSGVPPGGPGGPRVKPSDGPPSMGSAPAKVDRTRPVYAYPKVAQYIGKGSIDEAANFAAAQPARPWPTTFKWLGSGFYSAHYEHWCTASGTHFDCKKSP
jgi:hypothetical protein